MGKTILSIIAGIILAVIVVAIIQNISHHLYPPPEGLDYSDPSVLANLMMEAPVPALLIVIFGYSFGAFLGGFFTAKILNSDEYWPSLTVGGAILIGTLMNVQLIPHPTWFVIMGMILPLPAAYIGFHLAKKKTAQE